MALSIKDFDFERLPEIYQIEATNACQLHCWMCGREFMRREIGFLDPELIKKMIERDEFASSYMVELQMYGEPTLHPKLSYLIDLLHNAGVKVGMSTNAIDMDKHTTALRKLDYLTISMDAFTVETYNKIRRPDDPETFYNMVRGVELFLNYSDRPFVDIQCVVLPENKDEIEFVAARYAGIENTLVRTVEECFEGIRDESSQVKTHKLCLNPWLSVSIMWDGITCSCCFAYDKYAGHTSNLDFTYGNLNEQPLREIWQGSRAESMRARHLSGKNLYERCQTCIYRSPALLHWRMLMNWANKT